MNLFAVWLDPSKPFDSATIYSAEDFKTVMEKMPANTLSTPRTIFLNVSDLGGDCRTDGSIAHTMENNQGYFDDEKLEYVNVKYVSLDMSGSTFTTIGIGLEAVMFMCNNLTSVTIPASVTSIENKAFAGSNLTSVTFKRDDTTFAAHAELPNSNVNSFLGGASLQAAYSTGKAGTYTRSGTYPDYTWAKED